MLFTTPGLGSGTTQLLAGGARRIDPENPELDELAAAISAHAPDAPPPPPRQGALW